MKKNPLTPKRRNLTYVALGVAGLFAGYKVLPLLVFLKGVLGLERIYREQHGFTGSAPERARRALQFYDATHQHPVNRALHMLGIPVIVGGTLALLFAPAFSPWWWAGAAAFAGGWGLNFIGHGLFEKNGPSFAEDPLSFVAGPVWDTGVLRLQLPQEAGNRPLKPETQAA